MGSAPMWICGVQFMNDPYNERHVSFPRTAIMARQWVDIRIAVPPEVINAAYEAGGRIPDCRVLIKSTGGVRYVNLRAPSQLTREAREQIEQLFVIQCRTRHQEFWDRGRMELIRWPADPRFLAADLVRVSIWQVVVTGLRSREAISILDFTERVLGTAYGNQVGRAYLTALTPSVASGLEASLIYSADKASFIQEQKTPMGKDPVVGFGLLRLIEQARLPLVSPYLNHHVTVIRKVPVLRLRTHMDWTR